MFTLSPGAVADVEPTKQCHKLVVSKVCECTVGRTGHPAAETAIPTCQVTDSRAAGEVHGHQEANRQQTLHLCFVKNVCVQSLQLRDFVRV